MKRLPAFWAVLLVACAAGMGCGNADRNLASRRELSGGLYAIRVTSDAFREGQPIPKKYAAEGENVSPPLTWTRGPSGTVEYELIVQDPDSGRKQPAVHWAVYGIPADTTSLPENASATTSLVQGKNYLGENRYAGPNPSPGNKHRYFFQVFALDHKLNLQPGATLEDVKSALQRSAMSKGVLVGTYELQKK
jgi:Raf kinase inhibitor-like YbhB/YbcL family protein